MSIQSGIALVKRELTELERNVTICLKRRKRWPGFQPEINQFIQFLEALRE
jgi:hypothetical protein